MLDCVVLCLYIWCSSIQTIYARLTEEDLCLIALCYANIFGVAVFKAPMLE